MMYLKLSVYVVLLLIVTASSQARQNYSEQGIVTYKRLCKQCHGNPYKGAAMRKGKEWKRLFKGGDKRCTVFMPKTTKR